MTDHPNTPPMSDNLRKALEDCPFCGAGMSDYGESGPCIVDARLTSGKLFIECVSCKARGPIIRDPVADSWTAPAALWNARALASTPASSPIPMLLFCPRCGVKHVDEPDERTPDWTNPPHRSHLCHGCGCIWRQADVPTTGVAQIGTTGKADAIDLSALDRLPASSPTVTEEMEEFTEDALATWAALQNVEMIYTAQGLRSSTDLPFSWYVVGPAGEVAYCQMGSGQAHAEMIAAALNDRVAMCAVRSRLAAALAPEEGRKG